MIRFFAALLALLVPCFALAQPRMYKDTAAVINTEGQRDLIDIAKDLFNIKPKKVEAEEDKDLYFSFLPASSTVPGGGKALFTSTTAGFYTGDRSTTYLSSVTFAPYFNFKGRYGLPIRSNIWLKNNSWNIMGDTRVLKYPQYTWGIGGGKDNDTKLLLDYRYFRFYQSALKQIKPYFFAGIGYNLDYYINIETNRSNALRNFTGYESGTEDSQNSFSSGPSINLLYDTRNNSINPLPGCYANLVYRFSSPVFGSNNHWQSLYVDMRKYISLTPLQRKKNVLALWAYYWTTLTPGTPYLNLPSIGWDPYNRSGRGIEQNRFRGDGLIYMEGEYRRDITRNGLLGYVVFASVNSVTQQNTRSFQYWHPAGGAGLRLKFNKNSGTNIGVDYAVSRGFSTIMFNLGEAF
ncbi:BamA/TamA family outer membrane protein [Mucilaginibacter sp. JRF]|uniref:BamA/TamA family outer membrane protein n=1 Tax=Mucilaginibacter sp. JRF TaxID=2780088 RepID=UPI0018825991|nr:BamA/TamA family outer membrane protein [Mucilaginibacter sp. JRF]MBE9585261.1 BamA/TamA family outer membrane protein [Mucilaginibacter sp. JRF]